MRYGPNDERRRPQVSGRRRSSLDWLEGDDAFATHCAGHGHRSDLGERSAGADLELVDEPVPPGLDIEELPVGRGRSVDRSRIGTGPPEDCQLAIDGQLISGHGRTP